MNSFRRIDGPSHSALRHNDSRIWTVVPRARADGASLSVGLEIVLARPDAQRRGDPAVEAVRLADATRPARAPSGRATGAASVLAAPLIPALAGVLAGWSGLPAAPLATLADFGVALAGTAAGLLLTALAERALVAGELGGTTRWFGLRRGLPTLEPVVWRLGVAPWRAAAVLVMPLCIVAAALSLAQVAPAFAVGLAAGGALGWLLRLYPLDLTPTARLVEAATGVSNPALQLRWTLISRFLAPGARTQGGSLGMGLAALVVAAWVAAVALVFSALTSEQVTGGTLAGGLWRLSVLAGGAAYLIWLLRRLGSLFAEARRLAAAPNPSPFAPDPELQEDLRSRSGLVAHVPELARFEWCWWNVPAGSVLIRHGADDRSFYWIARGSADVIIRTTAGDPLHVATLSAGSGVGEIALLDGQPRTADVVAAEPLIVAELSAAAFDAVRTAELEQRFRQVVRAGQALSRADLFWGLDPVGRERWIAAGRPQQADTGEAVLREGEQSRWLGLIAEGEMAVRRGSQELAKLGADNVVGEMAYLTRAPRNADLVAVVPTLLWRWEPEWLDKELAGGGLRDRLAELAQSRRNESSQ